MVGSVKDPLCCVQQHKRSIFEAVLTEFWIYMALLLCMPKGSFMYAMKVSELDDILSETELR